MKITGLITEYNPFHNGHVHHIRSAKESTGADYLLVVMSGDFVQRGAPAIIDKYNRAKIALDSGADLILELPALFATGSSEIFARSAISLLHQLGAVDNICFGSETGELLPLAEIARVLNHEPKSFSVDIKSAVRSGLSYPAARALALKNTLGNEIPEIDKIMESPNNILGIEYLRALFSLKSDIRPFALKRWTTEHHDENAFYSDVASATALRKMIINDDDLEKIVPYMPPLGAREISLKHGIQTPIVEDDLSSMLQYRLLLETDRLTDYLDFSSEMADKVRKTLPDTYTFSEWANVLKSKNLVHTRIKRALLHLVLNFKTEMFEQYVEDDYCLYAKILGFRSDSAPLLSKIKRNTALPMITKIPDAKKSLSEKGRLLLESDLFARDVYRNVVYQKFGTMLKSDYTHGIIKF